MEGRGLMGGGERAPATTVENGRCLVPAEWHNADGTQKLSNPFYFHQANSFTHNHQQSHRPWHSTFGEQNSTLVRYIKTYPRYKSVTRQKPTTIEKINQNTCAFTPGRKYGGDTTVLLTSGGGIHDRNGEG